MKVWGWIALKRKGTANIKQTVVFFISVKGSLNESNKVQVFMLASVSIRKEE